MYKERGRERSEFMLYYYLMGSLYCFNELYLKIESGRERSEFILYYYLMGSLYYFNKLYVKIETRILGRL